MKDPEQHFITKAIKRLRKRLTKKKRLMLQAQDLQRQLTEAWWDKDQLEAENDVLKRENCWAQNFTCPKCGPCTPAMITTWKGCLYCGELLIRGKHPRLEELETENEALMGALIEIQDACDDEDGMFVLNISWLRAFLDALLTGGDDEN